MCSPCPSRGNRQALMMNGLIDSPIPSSPVTHKGLPKSFLGRLRRAIFSGSDRSKISEPFNPAHFDISEGTYRLLEMDLVRLNKTPRVRREVMRACAPPRATTGSTTALSASNMRPSAPARVLTCAALSSHPVAKLKKDPPADWRRIADMRRQTPLAYAVHLKRPSVQRTAPRSPAKTSTCPGLPSHPVGRAKKDERENYRVKTNLLAPPLPAQPLRSARGVRAPANLAHKKTVRPSAPAARSSRELTRSKAKVLPIDNKAKRATRPTPPAIIFALATPPAPATSPSPELTGSKSKTSPIDDKTKSTIRPTPPAIDIIPTKPSLPLKPRSSSRDIPSAHAYESKLSSRHLAPPSRDIPSVHAYESKVSSLRLVLIRRQAHHKDLEAQISVLSHQIAALAAQNVVEKEAVALATAKTLMQKREIAGLTEKLAQSRALVEAYRGEMAGLRARIAELEAAGRGSLIRRTGTIPASCKAPVSQKRLQTGEPLTPQERKTPVSPKMPAAPRKPLAPRMPAHKTSVATQNTHTEELFLPRMQDQRQQQQKPTPSSRCVDESLLRQNGRGPEPTPPPTPRLQAIPTAAVNLSTPIVESPNAVYRVRFKEMPADRVLPEMDTWVWASVPDLYLRDPRMWI